MRTLHVILERGFAGLEASVELDGRELLRSESLPSDMMKGFSAQVDAPLEDLDSNEPPQVLAVSLPGPALRLEVPLPVAGEDLWVVVRRTAEGLVSEVGTEPRGYM